MEIIRAEHSGFCFGVKRAIDAAFEEAEKASGEKRLFTCGQIIHNHAVTDYLESKGVAMIDSLDQASYGDTVIVRSHGEPEEFYKMADQKGIRLVDTTCVFVAKIHKLVNEASKEGRPVIIVGSRNHQEVVATNGWCGYNAVIIENPDEAIESIRRIKRLTEETGMAPLVVCQTTIRAELLDSILQILERNDVEYIIKNTICNATKDRQDSCAELASRVDAMIVVGGKNSSNTKKLYEIASRCCKSSYFVQNADELELHCIKKYNKIGIIAGASTPEWIIEEVISRMTINEENISMMDFMDHIDESLRLPKPGEIIEGTVVQVRDNEVIVNMGRKKDGILRADEVVLEEGQTLSDLYKVDDSIQAKVIKSDDGEGGILLSKKRLLAEENYDELVEAMENKTSINVTILRAVNGGVIAGYKEVTGFIPMSQLSDRFVEKADDYIGQSMDVKVLRVDARKNKAVFSRKAALSEEKKRAAEEIWSNLNVGDVVEGKVMRFTNYGAFVDIGGLDGLLHISEISWGKLVHPEEVLKVGDIINVKILALNKEQGKISLGYKFNKPEPWSLVGTKYNVGDVIQGKVVQLQGYGAFVEIEAGLDGLVHISEIANKRVETVSDELSVGQVVDVKIVEVDPELKRISLSIKAALPKEEAVEEAADEE